MSDLSRLLRSLSPQFVLGNVRREAVEYARVVAEVDAVVARIARTNVAKTTARSDADVGLTGATALLPVGRQESIDLMAQESLESAARAS